LNITISLSELLDSVFEVIGVEDLLAASKLKDKVLDNYLTTKAVCRAEEQLMQDLLEIVVTEIAENSNSEEDT